MSAGFLVVDKAPGMTSHDVVGIVRAVTGLKKVGHTGTLDPFATGVLVLALGGATRFIQFLDENLKVYDATIQFGASTETGDPEGDVVETGPLPNWELLPEVIQKMVGKQMQRPPAYSAVKYKGKPLYKYARAGEHVEVPAREIEIFSLDVLDKGEDWLRVELRCSRGTYARVIANDIAKGLGTVGHLSALRRGQSGIFELDSAVDMSGLAQIVAGRDDFGAVFSKEGERVKWKPRDEVCGAIFARVVDLAEALNHLPSVQCSDPDAKRLRNGGAAPPPPPGLRPGERYLALHSGVALAVAESEGRLGKPLRVVGEKSRRR